MKKLNIGNNVELNNSKYVWTPSYLKQLALSYNSVIKEINKEDK